MADLSRLGGQLGAENVSDQIWDQLHSVAEKMAVLRGGSYAHLILKLRMSFDFMEETLDPALRALLQSAIDDLRYLEAK